MRNPSEAEQTVLGACLVDENAFVRVMDKLQPQMFAFDQHRELWSVFHGLAAAGKPISAVLVAQEAPHMSMLVTEIYKNTPSARHVEHCAGYVKACWEQRELARIGREITDLANTGGTPAQAIDLLLGIAASEAGGLVASRERMADVVNYIEERFNAGGALIGADTGFFDLNNVLSGYRDGCLYIIAGRPGMGKTAFTLNTIVPIAKSGKPVLVFSMEMPSRELDLRLVSSIGGIHQEKVQNAQFSEIEWPQFTSAVAKIGGLPILVDDTSAQTLAAITAKSKRESLRAGRLGAVVVDYIGLMRGEGGDNRVQEIGNITRGLKALAKDLSCPVIALAQLNRKCEERSDKRPLMSDLRDSGDVEQDADVVIMLYRDCVYNPTSVLAENHIAEVLIRKNRHGELKELRVIDDLAHARFLNGDAHIYEIREQPAKGGRGGYG